MPLSPTAGPYQVSTLTLEVPLSTPCTFHPHAYRSHHSSPASSAPAFRLQTVLLTLFYPTDIPQSASSSSSLRKGTLPWLTSPRLKSIEGLLKYAGVSKYFALPAILPAYQLLFARLPFYLNAPLAATHHNRKWPTAIFSHGLGGTSVTYSSYLASLASHGVVIAAVEHRDGTCPATSIRTRSEDGSKVNESSLLYFKEEEVKVDYTTLEERGGKWDFRRAQLDVRRAELHEALKIITALNSGQGASIAASSTRGGTELAHANLSSWQSTLDVDDGVLLLGHSFGAATVLADQLASTSSDGSVQAGEKIKTKLAILLDPWLEPLPSSLDTSTSTNPGTPIYTINSQGFTVWSPNFHRLRKMLSSHSKSPQGITHYISTATTLLTLTGTRHTDFSDFPFLIPRLFSSVVEPTKCLKVFSEISRRAIFDEPVWSGEMEGSLELLGGQEVRVRWERESEAHGESKDMGEPGVVVQHHLH